MTVFESIKNTDCMDIYKTAYLVAEFAMGIHDEMQKSIEAQRFWNNRMKNLTKLQKDGIFMNLCVAACEYLCQPVPQTLTDKNIEHIKNYREQFCS